MNLDYGDEQKTLQADLCAYFAVLLTPEGEGGARPALGGALSTCLHQVEGAENVLVTAGTGVPTSGLILGQV